MIRFPLKMGNTLEVRKRVKELGGVFPRGNFSHIWNYITISKDKTVHFTSDYNTFTQCKYPYMSTEHFLDEKIL